MSSDHRERILQRPLISPTLGEPRPISTAPRQYLQSENVRSMGSEISESGWTMYFDQSVDSWRDKNATSQLDIEQQQKKNSQYTEDAAKYPTYDYRASSITGKEDSSLASDASSGPQKLPSLPVKGMEFEQDGQAAASYSLVPRRKRDAYDKREDSECMASCSVNFTRNKLRKVNKTDDEHELALWLQDTASSPIHRPEVQEISTLEVLQSLLPMEKRSVEKSCGAPLTTSRKS